MKATKEGWHKLMGYDVFVDSSGDIIRGTKETGNGEVTAYVYRWNRDYNSWVKEDKITPAAFCAGVKRGTIDLK